MEISPKVDRLLRNTSSFLHAQLLLGYEDKRVVTLRDENINIVYGCKFRKLRTQYAQMNIALGKL